MKKTSKPAAAPKGGFLAEPAKPGGFNSCKANTDGKKKSK